MTLAEIEREVILTSLARHGWDKAAVARELGISLRTVYRKLKDYGVARPATGVEFLQAAKDAGISFSADDLNELEAIRKEEGP